MRPPSVVASTLAVAALTSAGLAVPRPSAPPSPYAEMGARDVKALSAGEIEGYLAGDGMGLALAAELNGYPGPKHVLELADALGLDPGQAAAIREVFEAMREDAVRLGALVVEAERELDRRFASGTITVLELEDRLERLGRLEGELRFVHLNAHLETLPILTDDQIERYSELRGYGAGAPPDHTGRHGHSGR